MKLVFLWLVGLALVLLSLVSLLPLIEINDWWVRYLDFPRMQVTALLVVFGLAFALLGGFSRAGIGLFLLVLAALVYQGTKLYPYQQLARAMDAGGATCAEGQGLSIVVANVQRDNQKTRAVLSLAAEQDADVLLLLETDERWDEELSPLGERYAHHAQSIPEEATFFGMHVYSKFPLEEAEFRTPFGADTPLFSGTLLHPAGEVRLFGVHPRPPQSFEQGTIMRDATVLEAALEAAADPRPAIVAGDYNATPWERTARRAMRLAGLLDPRVGRGPMVSFDANSRWQKWPLDQILWQQGLGMADFRVLGPIGSDHLPVRADLCPGIVTDQQPAPVRADDLAEAETAIAAARALSGGAGGG